MCIFTLDGFLLQDSDLELVVLGFLKSEVSFLRAAFLNGSAGLEAWQP